MLKMKAIFLEIVFLIINQLHNCLDIRIHVLNIGKQNNNIAIQHKSCQ